jgi:cytochrome bd-type quinol oxidase subunit 1
MPVSPLVFAILFGLLSVGAFVLGLKAYRATALREGVTVDQSRRFGRLMMMAATALLLFLVAVIVRGDFKVMT